MGVAGVLGCGPRAPAGRTWAAQDAAMLPNTWLMDCWRPFSPAPPGPNLHVLHTFHTFPRPYHTFPRAPAGHAARTAPPATTRMPTGQGERATGRMRSATSVYQAPPPLYHDKIVCWEPPARVPSPILSPITVAAPYYLPDTATPLPPAQDCSSQR